MYIYIYCIAPVVQYCTVYTVRKEMKCSRETVILHELVHDTVLRELVHDFPISVYSIMN